MRAWRIVVPVAQVFPVTTGGQLLVNTNRAQLLAVTQWHLSCLPLVGRGQSARTSEAHYRL